jgi:acyl-CoA hydrolase
VIVFVALDAPEGKPMPVPAWTPTDDEDRRLAEYAQQVMALSRAIEPMIEGLPSTRA